MPSPFHDPAHNFQRSELKQFQKRPSRLCLLTLLHSECKPAAGDRTLSSLHAAEQVCDQQVKLLWWSWSPSQVALLVYVVHIFLEAPLVNCIQNYFLHICNLFICLLFIIIYLFFDKRKNKLHSWCAGQQLAWQPPPSVYECINYCESLWTKASDKCPIRKCCPSSATHSGYMKMVISLTCNYFY